MNFTPLTGSAAEPTPPPIRRRRSSSSFSGLSTCSSIAASTRKRNAVFLPMVHRMDLSVTQDLFAQPRRPRHSGQIRLDITQLRQPAEPRLGRRPASRQQSDPDQPGADANGALTYHLQTLSGNPITTSYQSTAGLPDVYVMMLTFRYTFN